MSSVLVLKQSSSVHMATDALVYERDGTIVYNNACKAHALPTLSAAISVTGPALFTTLLAARIACQFGSFDELVDEAEEWIPQAFNEVADETRGGDASSSLYLIGWHGDSDRPAAYGMDVWTDDSSRVAQIKNNSPNAAAALALRSKLVPVDFAGTPIPAKPLRDAAGFKMHTNNNEFIPEVDLLHLMEIQRHERIEGAHWVGGKAMLVSITRQGITQRCMHHWVEDVIGESVTPLPIDYRAWRSERMRMHHGAGTSPVEAEPPAGLNRQQRLAWKAKNRKRA